MSDGLDGLRALQKLDAQIFALRAEIEKKPNEVKRQDKEAADAAIVLAEVKTNLGALRRRVDEANVRLKAAEEVKKKLETQAQTLKTNAEYDAMKRQIAAKQEEILALEEKVLEGMEVVDTANRELPAREKELAERQAALERARAEGQAVVKAKQSEIAVLEVEWSKQSQGIPSDVLRNYESLRSRYGAKCVVVVTPEGMCQGCYLSITSQDLNQIFAGHSVQCRHCQRILWMP